MKISQTSIILIIAALIFGALAVKIEMSATQIRVDDEIKFKLRKKEEARKYLKKTNEPMPSFSGGDGYEPKRNYADYLVLSCIVISLSSFIAAIWLRKFDS